MGQDVTGESRLTRRYSGGKKAWAAFLGDPFALLNIVVRRHEGKSVGLVVINIVVSACVIAFAAWLSRQFPGTAGFIVALPLATMLVLPLAYFQHGDGGNTILMAKSIFVAVPITLAFFIPFLLSGRFGLTFWQAYAYGCLALVLGYFIHRVVVRAFWVSGT